MPSCDYRELQCWDIAIIIFLLPSPGHEKVTLSLAIIFCMYLYRCFTLYRGKKLPWKTLMGRQSARSTYQVIVTYYRTVYIIATYCIHVYVEISMGQSIDYVVLALVA